MISPELELCACIWRMRPAVAVEFVNTNPVSVESFYEPKAKRAFASISAAIANGHMPTEGELALATDPSFVASLSAVSAKVSQAQALARVVDERRQRRVAIAAFTECTKALGDLNKPLAETLASCAETLSVVRAQTDSLMDGQELINIVASRLKEMRKGWQGIIKTGLIPWDKATGGLQRNLTVIGSDPGAGKSGLLAALVLGLILKKKRVTVYSLEDEPTWLINRIWAAIANIPQAALMFSATQHQLDEAESIADGLRGIVGNYLTTNRLSPLSARAIVASAKDAILRKGTEAVFVDHLGEIDVPRQDALHEEVGFAITHLRSVTKQFNIPLVLLAHLKRRDHDEVPTLTDFALTANVERKARVLIALTKGNNTEHFDGEATKFVSTAHCLKNTNGPIFEPFEIRYNAKAAMPYELENAP